MRIRLFSLYIYIGRWFLGMEWVPGDDPDPMSQPWLDAS